MCNVYIIFGLYTVHKEAAEMVNNGRIFPALWCISVCVFVSSTPHITPAQMPSSTRLFWVYSENRMHMTIKYIGKEEKNQRD
jgi:hypothetical protein